MKNQVMDDTCLCRKRRKSTSPPACLKRVLKGVGTDINLKLPLLFKIKRPLHIGKWQSLRISSVGSLKTPSFWNSKKANYSSHFWYGRIHMYHKQTSGKSHNIASVITVNLQNKVWKNKYSGTSDMTTENKNASKIRKLLT